MNSLKKDDWDFDQISVEILGEILAVVSMRFLQPF